MLSAERRARLARALLGAFANRIEALRELASYYDAEGLPIKLPGPAASAEELVHGLLRSSCELGEQLAESFLRGARRRRPGNLELARAVHETWPFAEGLDFECLDDLGRQLRKREISIEQLQHAARRALGAERPPLWSPRGPEPAEDLIEGLAQLRGHPPKLVRVAQQMRHVPEIAAWIGRTAPDVPDVRDARDARDARDPDAQSPTERMLLLLRRAVNDRYAGEIYFSGPDGNPRFVSSLREQAPLGEIPAVFAATRAENDDLRYALLASDLSRIEVMLPVRDLFAHVEHWDLLGSGPIGELYPVVVRPLERAFAMQHDDYVGGAMLLRDAWRTLRRAPSMERVELDVEQVNTAVRRHPRHWCVAAFRCPDPGRADRLAALDRLVKRGVAAMLAVRHDQAWPEHLRAELSLPHSVHSHRCDRPEHPVMLLWDDVDFIPGSKK